MTVAELTWTETPAKRPYAWQPVSATWSTSDMRDLMFKRHHRQRLFVRLFDLFTATVPNLAVLSLPFDWSERSLMLLTRLANLRDIRLSKYFRYAPVNADLFTDTFASLPKLRRLSIELWTESSGGFSYFQLKVDRLCFDRVPTPPGKSWIYNLEYRGNLLLSGNILEINAFGFGKSWKNIIEVSHHFLVFQVEHKQQWCSLC